MTRLFDIEEPNTFPSILCRMKGDMTHYVVPRERGIEMARDFGIPWIECSAKTGENIERMFRLAVEQVIIKRFTEVPVVPASTPPKPSSTNNRCSLQ